VHLIPEELCHDAKTSSVKEIPKLKCLLNYDPVITSGHICLICTNFQKTVELKINLNLALNLTSSASKTASTSAPTTLTCLHLFLGQVLIQSIKPLPSYMVDRYNRMSERSGRQTKFCFFALEHHCMSLD
jgi:hypothetical protein